MVDVKYEEKDFGDEEIYVRCKSIEEFRAFCEDGFWGDEHGFYQDTGIDFSTVENKWFQVVHSRVYLQEDA